MMTSKQKQFELVANREIFALAHSEIGTWEWAGSENNPAVVAYYSDAGHPEVVQDSVPWCAAFVGSVLSRCGVEPTGSLLARSYLDWGVPVALADAQLGDLVIFERGSSGWQGHVTIYAGRDALGRILGLGGNQSDQVNISTYAADDKLLGVRRAKVVRDKLVQSSTIRATGTGAVTALGVGGSAIGALDGVPQLVAIVGLLVVLLCFLWIARERIRRWVNGDR